jgi:hypothetical protein
MKKPATSIRVKINKKFIWPSGELGSVEISKAPDEKIEITIEQARSLLIFLQGRLS